jgi:nitric oxide reductase subunit C
LRRPVWQSSASIWLVAGVLAIVIAQACELDDAASAARGDTARGERLFKTLPCVSCHDVTTPWPGGDICPNLGNIATEAARIIRLREYRGKARTAADYIRESIVDPNAYIVPGASYRTADGQSVMPKDFGTTLTGAQIDDLVAYLLTRR